MKKGLFLILGILLFSASGIQAQYIEVLKDTTVYVQWDLSIKTEFEEDSKNLTRFKKDMDRFVQDNQVPDSIQCDLLFIGSSSFKRWSTVKHDMAPAKVINRAFGGSMSRNILYSYDIVVKPMQPKKIVLYVENDLPSKKYPVQIFKTFDFFRVLCERMRSDFPDVPIYILSLKPSVARTAVWPSMQILNSLLKEYCASTPNFTYIDVATPMLDENKQVLTDIFVQDQLHMNEKGYAIWTKVLRDNLLKDFPNAETATPADTTVKN